MSKFSPGTALSPRGDPRDAAFPVFGHDTTSRQLWHEAAALVRERPRDGCPRELLREGRLWELLVYVDALDAGDQADLLIALPDRRVPPLRYDTDGIRGLLGRPDRPGFGRRG